MLACIGFYDLDLAIRIWEDYSLMTEDDLF